MVGGPILESLAERRIGTHRNLPERQFRRIAIRKTAPPAGPSRPHASIPVSEELGQAARAGGFLPRSERERS
jgi:hypothetical protein